MRSGVSFGVEWEVAVRILAGAVLGSLVGLEREADDQPAGLRTHITVAVGAALFGVISTAGFEPYIVGSGLDNTRIDYTRVASQVVVGIGFLGAGLIFRQGSSVRNLTTAATLWAVAAIGLSAGIGDVGAAAVTAVVVLVVLLLVRLPRQWIHQTLGRHTGRVRITLATGAAPGPIIAAVADVKEISIDRQAVLKDRGQLVVAMTLVSKRGANIDDCLIDIAQRPDVDSLDET